ncbi:MAG: BON domain-containing protein [Steroidobacteraceae bacterium]
MKPAWQVLLVALPLGGCVAAVIGQGGGSAGSQAGGQTVSAPAPSSVSADARLAADVRARLAAEKGLPAGAIEVRVRAGMVTLRGRVAGEAQRAVAERAVRSVPGVKAVVSELEVR